MTIGLRLSLLRRRISEYLSFDSAVARAAVAAAMSMVAAVLYLAGRSGRAVDIAMKLDRGDYPGPLPGLVRRALSGRPENAQPGDRLRASVRRACEEQVSGLQRNSQNAKVFDNPSRLLGTLAMVLKSPAGDEKGVLLLLYSYVLPLFWRLFDLDAIRQRYHLIIEPSWSGYCNPEVLCYRYLDDPVFVQAYEPRDRAFIDELHSNLVSIPTSNNWWVDHRVFAPIPGVTKDIDAIMVAGWGDYKRHVRFFAALRALARRGVRLRTALVGYPLGLQVSDLRVIAKDYGIGDQIEWFENLSQKEVNVLFNRSKVNVLWSRKEGVNRAIIEGMFAGVPCIVRTGFNYGYEYPYINFHTGRFATEADLPAVLLSMVEKHASFSPREWVKGHMSCEIATRIVEDVMQAHLPEPWSSGLAVKVNALDGMQYWNADDRTRFADDYAFLTSTIREGR